MFSWLFEKRKADERDFEGAIRGLEDRLLAVERKTAGIELEWATTFTKLQRLAGHVTKSAAIDAAKNGGQEESPRPRIRTPHEMTRDEIANLKI